jgi:hypothetical protein
MGIGIQYNEDGRTPREVPGTCIFDPPLDIADSEPSALKRDKKNPELILQPQPSEDVADPLNW